MRHIIWLLCGFLFACGGSGGGDSDTGFTADFKDESLFADRCVAPRSGLDPRTNEPWPDQQGTVTDQNNWLRSWMNDKYFWYDRIVDRDPSLYSTIDYFDLMISDAKTSSGEKRDKFSRSTPTEREIMRQSGVSLSFGIRWISYQRETPRDLRVAYVEPGSPADDAGIKRGDRLSRIDGVSFISDRTKSGVQKISDALSRQTSVQSYTFGFTTGASYTLTAREIEITPVIKTEVLPTDSGKVGYIAFNSHIAKAQDQLITAVNQLKTENVNDLVLDLRYNGGGLIYIASQLAYMIAGPDNTLNQTFGVPAFNDKYPLINPFINQPIRETPFFSIKIDDREFTLPSLNLNRVFVLTSGSTCSASELIMNSLRGINIEVIQIGNSTCGKSTGFYPTDNCGTTFFATHFQTVNAKGFGDYDISGFTPSAVDNGKDKILGCVARDDTEYELGDPREARLAEALFFRKENRCLSPQPSAISSFASSLTRNSVEELFPPIFNDMIWHE